MESSGEVNSHQTFDRFVVVLYNTKQRQKTRKTLQHATPQLGHNTETTSADIAGTPTRSFAFEPPTGPPRPSHPLHSVLAIFLQYSSYYIELNSVQQHENAKKHVQHRNQNVKRLISATTNQEICATRVWPYLAR